MAAGWPDKDDHELLALLREGSHAAFAELTRRHSDRFYRLAYRYMRQREAAEDIVQDAFLKLWVHPDQWQPGHNARFTTWFYRVVINLCLDAQKRKTPLPLAEEFEIADDAQAAQDDALIEQREQAALEAAIAALPERQYTALNLCFVNDLSNQEAAEVMGLTLKALQSLIMRAKAVLKEQLKPVKGEQRYG